MGVVQLWGHSGGREVLAVSAELTDHRRADGLPHPGGVVDRGLRLRASEFFGDRFLFNYLILGLTFPFATAILPLFIKVRDLGLLDTHWGIILPQVAFGLAISVLLLRNSFRQLPFELVESALVDGCSYPRIFFSIILPLSRPILSTVAIIAFVTSWNNFLLPLVVLNTGRKWPWPLGLMDYQGEYMTFWQLVLAFITLTILPAIVMFVLAQKHIVAGLTAGAVKG